MPGAPGTFGNFQKRIRSFGRDWSTVPGQRYGTGTANFYITQKNVTVRWVSCLRELNKVVKKNQYTLPIITDVLRRRKGYV